VPDHVEVVLAARDLRKIDLSKAGRRHSLLGSHLVADADRPSGRSSVPGGPHAASSPTDYEIDAAFLRRARQFLGGPARSVNCAVNVLAEVVASLGRARADARAKVEPLEQERSG
jgi:hypothetical protein